jgi:DNA invertase Pin-like site-specific DNA recombinase
MREEVDVTPPEERTEHAGSVGTARYRAEIVAAMGELADASRELKMLFDRLDMAMGRAAAAIEAGTSPLELARSMNLPGRRETLNEVTRRAREGEHALLRALFRAAEADGASKAEIARTWRISRQLVSRMIREPR